MSELRDDFIRVAKLRGLTDGEIADLLETIEAQPLPPPASNALAKEEFKVAVGVYVDMEVYDELPPRSRRFLQNAPGDMCAQDWKDLLRRNGDNEARVIRGAVRMLQPKYGTGWLGMARATAQ